MRKNSPGFSLMEIVIAIAIIGIFFTGITAVFFQIGKGIMITRTRTVATNLAQERIESLKNVSYSRLRVTSSLDYSTYGYDNTFYPPETGILVGDIPYRREVIIQRAAENGSGQLEEVAPDAGDTSLKKVTVTVKWTEEGRSNTFSLSNLREDPDRRPMDGTISGTVQDQDTTALLNGVKVAVFDNLNWNAVTDASGAYSIKVP
ncbi:MAG: prepilin-type N-terminal cleavage/methylation domain-containing protein, partial [Endomicrobiales bacterium]